VNGLPFIIIKIMRKVDPTALTGKGIELNLKEKIRSLEFLL
jgi:hypothetical protein